jgi:hypothetical protein
MPPVRNGRPAGVNALPIMSRFLRAVPALYLGLYQYKFIVDEDWIVDPAAQKNVPNEHGSLNSVVEVRA